MKKRTKTFGKSKIGVQIQGFKNHKLVNGKLNSDGLLSRVWNWIFR